MKENKKFEVDKLLALAHILDKYENFRKNLIKFVSSKYNRDDIYNLYEVSNGKMVLSPKARKFYKNNKEVIDIINKYLQINTFIYASYKSNGEYNKENDVDYFYKYLKDNEDKLDDIILLLEKIKKLGFRDFELTEENFKDKEYQFDLCAKYSFFTEINYLENMESIPTYQKEIIKYKTKGSNYCIQVPVIDDATNSYNKKIILNNLFFDSKLLPKSLKKEDIYDKLIPLKQEKEEEELALKESVELGIGIADFESQFEKLSYIVYRLENIENKDKLKKALIDIKESIDSLKKVDKNNNDNVIEKNNTITSELIEKEKQKYLSIREFQQIDLC